mgnify:FL=1|tara:strand:- start:112 stop:963 length:852 start_codon:yes stop_codon:yes gene_type:complete
MNPFKQKRGLGRGLSSLIGETNSKNTNNIVSISSLIRGKFQPRKNFDKESLAELSQSIKERGIIQPIIVRKSKDANDKFEIIAGERRWQAAQMAGLHEVPVVKIEADDSRSLEFGIVENVQRTDLNPIEEAAGYKRLIDEFNYDQDKVANLIGKSRTHITNCLRILTLPKEVISIIEKGDISQGHAKILVGLDNAEFIAKKIVKKKLSVRQSESLVRVLKSSKIIRSQNNVNSDVKSLENSIEIKTGIKTFIRNKKNNSGTIGFEYKNLDQLNRLIEVIKSNY